MYRTVVSAGRRFYLIKTLKTTLLTHSPSKSPNVSFTLARCSSSLAQKFSLEQIAPPGGDFMRRHIGPDAVEQSEMLGTLNLQVT